MAKVTFQMTLFNMDYVLEEVISAIRPFGQVIAVEGPVRYFENLGYSTSTDKTNQILDKFNVPTIHAAWNEKDAMMTAGEYLIPSDTTHVWVVDGDEVWTAGALERTIAILDKFDSVSFKPMTFFGGFERVLTGFETRFDWIRIQRWHKGASWKTHRPPTVLSPSGVPYRKLRHYDSPENFFHYSYVFPKQVQSKTRYYASRGSGTIPNYFETVWLPWVRGGAAEREHIEEKYEGVHEWLPARRKDCYTARFDGAHPLSIQHRMSELKRRFEAELREVEKEYA